LIQAMRGQIGITTTLDGRLFDEEELENSIESRAGGCDDLQLLDNPTTSPVYVGRLRHGS
jgi:hypothetical protein